MNILITGADGFIGSHLTEKLLKAGHKVKALSYYNSFNSIGWLKEVKNKTKNLKIISGDIRDFNFLYNHTKSVDIIFHLASLIAIPYSYVASRSYIDTNIIGTHNVLECSRIHNVKKIIHTSTSEVYGSAQYVPIDENHPNVGQSPYSASKIAADQLAISYHNSFGLPLTILRPFNTYGPRQSTRAVIPTIITQILQGSGEVYLGNKNTTRDFNYVHDVVDAFCKTIKNKKINGKTINIGSGFEIKITDLANLISEIIGRKIKIKYEKQRDRPKNSEVNRLLASNKKAKYLLNWQPKYSKKTGLTKALKETIMWYNKKENLQNFRSNYSL